MAHSAFPRGDLRREDVGGKIMREGQLRWLWGGLGAGCFALLMAMELFTDPERKSVLDVAGEAFNLLLIIGSAVGVALLVQRIQSQHEERVQLVADLATARAEGEHWRASVAAHLAGLSAELDNQFESWGLTAAEQDVGRLLLKGLSHKEIALLRATSDATVRQQAQSIYRKASLPGRSAFSAYFLDDFLSPPGSSALKGASAPQSWQAVSASEGVETRGRAESRSPR
jgi:DNA-binding CsgD family transcriptional regulator